MTTYAAPMLLAYCAICSAREGLDVYVMPGHRHGEPEPARAWPVGFTATWTRHAPDVTIPAGRVVVLDHATEETT